MTQNQILSFAAAAVPGEVQARLPAAETIKRVLHRVRANHLPKDPNTLRELIIEGHWSQTSGEYPTTFLKYDNGPDADERAVIFVTEVHLQQLASCEVWCMDGTFAVATRLFHQSYVVQGKYNGGFLPFAYALLQRKTQTSYEAMLCVLEEAGCDPSVVIVDFERIVELALHAVFGEHVNIQYCFYHLTLSIWRKIQSLGLTNLYESNDNFCLFCGQIDALAFPPLDEVPEGMAFLRESAPEAATPLVEYFETNYVTGHLHPRPQTQDLQLRFWRVPPIFAPAQWNVHEVTFAEQLWTNNVSEGWNNKFQSLVGQSHPTVSACKWNALVSRLLRDERGVRPKKRTKKVYTEPQGRLRNLCEDRSLGRKSIPDFLRGVSHNLRDGRPNI